MHTTLLLCLSLLLAICLLVGLSRRLRIAYPILLVLGGLGLSLLPGLPHVAINPDLIFLIFLPPLLYGGAWVTSWKDFWRWRRVIGFLAFGLVLLTAGAVALVAGWLIPGCTLALGFLLGGIVSPPDAVAASSVMRGLHLPRRMLSILEGESLVNDASSLIVLRFALAAVLSGSFVWYQALGSFVVVTVVGIGTGLAVGLVFYAIHRWLQPQPSTNTVLTLLTPYLMYLLAEAAHGSGVLAVVSGGLFLSYHSSRLFSPANRQQASSTWSTVDFVLNGAVFTLIGLELPAIVEGLGAYSWGQAVGYGLAISATVIVTRLVFALLGSPFSTFMSRFIMVADAHPGWRGPLVVGYAGMRGVVSLAAALSIPLHGPGGQPFPGRNLLIFITFIVILVTLVGQGLTLPLLIRWVRPADPDHLRPEAEQRVVVRQALVAAALGHLRTRYARHLAAHAQVARLEQDLAARCQVAAAQLQHPPAEDPVREATEYHQILLDLLLVERRELARLGEQLDYNDEVIRRQETQLDLEEQKLRMVELLPAADGEEVG